jgi:hypothetical protein
MDVSSIQIVMIKLTEVIIFFYILFKNMDRTELINIFKSILIKLKNKELTKNIIR